MNRNVIGTILDELVDVCWFFLPVCQHWSTVGWDDDCLALIDTSRQGTLSQDKFCTSTNTAWTGHADVLATSAAQRMWSNWGTRF